MLPVRDLMISRVFAARLTVFLAMALVVVGCGEDRPDGGQAPEGASVSSVAARPSGSSGGGDGSGVPEVLARNVIVISIDTLRRDRLDVYGARRSTSPNLEAFSQRSVVFDDARAQSAQTAPSHASLFTSRYPAVHQVINVHGLNPQIHRLPEGLTTLAEVVHQQGVQTAAFVSGGNLTRRMGMDRGFDVWDEHLEDVSGRIDAAVAWMFAPERKGKRFLTLIHTYQVHAPYLPPADIYPQFVDPEYQGPLRARLEKYLSKSTEEAWEAAVGPEYWDGLLEYTDADVRFLSDLYDAEIFYVDSQLRRLFQYVLQSELARDTAIVILADHGEEFRDHGKFQHDQVFDELLRVPLIMRFPGGLERDGYKGRVPEPVGLVDVGPTVAEIMGIEWPSDERSGRSLLELIGPRRDRAWQVRPIFSELVVDPGPKTYRSVVWQGWKYIHARQADIDHTWEWLFHLEVDPLERSNLIDSTDPDVVRVLAALRAQLQNYILDSRALSAGVGAGDVSDIDDETRQLMIQLGYIEGESDASGPGAATGSQKAPVAVPPKTSDGGGASEPGSPSGPTGPAGG